MVYYIQRECNLDNSFLADSIVEFDTPIAISKQPEQPDEDFRYNENGTFDVLRAGMYTVFWYVTDMSGFSTIGHSYELKKRNYTATTQKWDTIAGTSNHIKVSQTPGFSIVIVSQDEIDDYGNATIALFNTADIPPKLTNFTPKAGILLFGFNFESLENQLTSIDGQILDIFDQLGSIEKFVHLSNITEIWSHTPKLSGLGASVINSGYTYNFWGIGTLNHQQTLDSGAVYYLVESSQYEPLTYYQGDSTIGTLWIETTAPSSEIHSIPIRFDDTGIYFIPNITYQNLPPGTVFKFTQAIILVDTLAGNQKQI